MLLLGMASHLWVTPEPGSSVLSHSAHSTPASAFFSTLIRPQLNPNDALCPPPYISPFWGAKGSDGTGGGIVDVAAGGGAIGPGRGCAEPAQPGVCRGKGV